MLLDVEHLHLTLHLSHSDFCFVHLEFATWLLVGHLPVGLELLSAIAAELLRGWASLRTLCTTSQH